MTMPTTLGELRQSPYGESIYKNRRMKDEMRQNLISKLQRQEPLFPGIIGYQETVIPQIINAVLSRHNMILLGLRGQAKSRILRSLISLLDEQTPVVAGCEINDNPYAPLCRQCKQRREELGDALPVSFLDRESRYVEKLATPDVTIADIIGDIDPIRAARGGLHLADELTIHFGLLPRANRGLFVINELPDLAGKVQVGLFNIMQEGDIQIKGYPIRLPLDVALLFTANPEDYTARGKIITPLKDRIGSEIRTHYPTGTAQGMEITRQEAWLQRGDSEAQLFIPDFIAEMVEEIAFQARKDSRVDKRSGVSQRLPITAMENVISNAERRALASGESRIVPRVLDIYAALPSITGKIELAYEGELQGGDAVALDLIRAAVGQIFSARFHNANFRPIIEWFDMGGALQLSELESSAEALKALRKIQGLLDKLSAIDIDPSTDDTPTLVSGGEFILEGLYAQRKINRNQEKGYVATERKKSESLYEELERGKRPYGKKPYN